MSGVPCASAGVAKAESATLAASTLRVVVEIAM
jgi:hypothetical protein